MKRSLEKGGRDCLLTLFVAFGSPFVVRFLSTDVDADGRAVYKWSDPSKYNDPPSFGVCGAGTLAFCTCFQMFIVMPILAASFLLSGYGSYAFEIETLCFGKKLAAGSDFNPHQDESDVEKLERLFQHAAVAGLMPAAMAAVAVDDAQLLSSLLADAGIELPGDRLRLIMHLREDPRLAAPRLAKRANGVVESAA